MEPVIEIKNLKINLGGTWIHRGINLSINRGEVFAIVGGSGAGKSLLLRQILNLEQPTSGSISIFQKNLQKMNPDELLALQNHWGVMFQHSALFSSLTVLENVAFPLTEHTTLDPKTINQLALLKIVMAELPASAAYKYPSELSGGMEKRAALARAIVMDPELLFLDEPTAGLDPHAAAGLDELVLNLKKNLGLTIVLVTHDLDTLWTVTDRVAFLGEGKVLAVAPMAELVKDSHPEIKEFFSGPRGRVAQNVYDKE